MGLINIDYWDTLKKADQLDALANELRAVAARDLQNLQSGVGKSWKGSSAELYKKRTQSFSRQVEAQAKELQNVAGSLRAAAEFYRRVEAASHALFGG